MWNLKNNTNEYKKTPHKTDSQKENKLMLNKGKRRWKGIK